MTLALVIPVRNDAENLARLLRQAATMDVFDEVIVVDDGSEKAIERHMVPECFRERFVLRRLETAGGAGAARNRGLDEVTADHLVFFDSDDLFTREFPYLWRSLADEDFDFCIFRHNDSRATGHGGWGQMPFDNVLWRKAGCGGSSLRQVTGRSLLCLAETANYPWNKIYRTAFLKDNKLRCSEIPFHGDVELHWTSFLMAERIMASDRIAAIHFVRSGDQRLTNRNDAKRLLAFKAFSRVAHRIRRVQGSDGPLMLSYLRFLSGLTNWIRGHVLAEQRGATMQAMACLLREHLDRNAFGKIAAEDAAIALQLMSQMAGNVPAPPTADRAYGKMPLSSPGLCPEAAALLEVFDALDRPPKEPPVAPVASPSSREARIGMSSPMHVLRAL